MGDTDRARRARGAERGAPAPVDGAGDAAPSGFGRGAHTDLLALNRLLGNRTASQLIDAAQTKLEVGGAGDAYELEADSVARQVMASIRDGSAADATPGQGLGARVQRRRGGSGGAGGGPLDGGTEAAIRGSAGGRPMPAAVQEQMGSAFGEDFSSVRFHAGERAAALNQALSAKAFTVGDDVFFRDGVPDTTRAAGQELVAHELTHTLQQRGGGGRSGALQRLYVETEDRPEGRVGPEGQQVGYRWMPGAKVEDHVVSPVKTGWKAYNLYRPKATPAATTTTTTKADPPKGEGPTPPTPTPPVLTPTERTEVQELARQLKEWGDSGVQVPKEAGTARRTALQNATARLDGTGSTPVDEIRTTVTNIGPTYREKIAERDRKKELAEKERKAEAQKKLDLEAAGKLNDEVKKACGAHYAPLSALFDDSKLKELLVLADGPTLRNLTASYPSESIEPLLTLTADRGVKLKGLMPKIKRRDDIATLRAVKDLTDARLLALLADLTSTELIELATLVPSGIVLMELRRTAADVPTFVQTATELGATTFDVTKAAPKATANDGSFATGVTDHRKAEGLVGENGTAIKWMQPTKIAGDGDANEQQAVTDALAHYDAGTVDATAYYSRGPHENRAGHLPGARNAIPYQEWGITQATGVTGAGVRRFVIDPGTKRIYYTWTHYGTSGTPAFVRIR